MNGSLRRCGFGDPHGLNGSRPFSEHRHDRCGERAEPGECSEHPQSRRRPHRGRRRSPPKPPNRKGKPKVRGGDCPSGQPHGAEGIGADTPLIRAPPGKRRRRERGPKARPFDNPTKGGLGERTVEQGVEALPEALIDPPLTDQTAQQPQAPHRPKPIRSGDGPRTV